MASLFIQADVVYAVGLKFRDVFVDAVCQLRVILRVDVRVIHIAQRQLLCEDLKEDRILVVHDGLVDAALGEDAGGDDLVAGDLKQGMELPQPGALGKYFAFHLIIVIQPVAAAGGIEDPVADIDEIQQPAEFFICKLDIHGAPPIAIYSDSIL